MPTNVWFLTVPLADVWKNPELSFDEQVEKIVERIKASTWRSITPYPHTFDELLATLEKSSDAQEFNATWDEVMDLADLDRVWVELF